jgi:hypothetical protein
MSTQYHIDMLNEMIENKLLYSYCEDLRAAAARLAELERENARMREIARLAQECADDLEAEVKSRWIDADGSIHPALQRKFDRDMSIVIELRAALAGSGEP